MEATSESVGSTSQPRVLVRDIPQSDRVLYWCGYLNSSKASFALSPDERHAVIEVMFRSRRSPEILRAELSVNGQLEEVHARRSEFKWRLTECRSFVHHELMASS